MRRSARRRRRDQTPPTAEGGALRAQSIRARPATRRVLNGSIIRVDPATGAALPDNPLPLEHRRERAPDRRLRLPQPVPVHDPARHQRGLDRRRRLERPGRRSTGSSTRWPPTVAQLRLAVLRGRRPASPATRRQPRHLCSSLYAAPARGCRRRTTPTATASRSCPARPARPAARRSPGSRSTSGGTYPAAYTDGAVLRRLLAQLHLGHARGHQRPARPGPDRDVRRRPPPTRSTSQIGPGRRPLLRRLRRRHDPPRSTTPRGNQAPTARDRRDARPAAPSPLTVALRRRPARPTRTGDTLTYAWDLDGDGAVRRLDGREADVHVHRGRAHYTVRPARDRHPAARPAPTRSRSRPATPARPPIDRHPAPASPGRSATRSPSRAARPTPRTARCPPRPDLVADPAPLPVATATPTDPDFDRRRQRLVRGARPRVPVLPRADADRHGLRRADRHSTTRPARPADGRPDLRVEPDRALAGRRDHRGPTPFTRTVIVGLATSASTAPTPADARRHDLRLRRPGRTAARRRTRSSPPRRPRPTPRTTSSPHPAPRATCSDLAYTVTANGWGPVEKDKSNGEQAAGDGKPMTLNGTVYAKGSGPRRLGRPLHDGQLHRVHRLGRGRRRDRQHPRLDRLPGLPRRRRRLRLGDDDRGDRDQGGQRQHTGKTPCAWSSRPAPAGSTTATATGPTPS